MMSADDHHSKRKSSEFITKLMSILEVKSANKRRTSKTGGLLNLIKRNTN